MTEEVMAQLNGLRSEHADLEKRLNELERHLSLSPEEQVERINLKKAKLLIKDKIRSLEASEPIARWRRRAVPAGAFAGGLGPLRGSQTRCVALGRKIGQVSEQETRGVADLAIELAELRKLSA